MVEILLGGQGKKDFIRFKKTVTKSLITSDSTSNLAPLRGNIEDFQDDIGQVQESGFQVQPGTK